MLLPRPDLPLGCQEVTDSDTEWSAGVVGSSNNIGTGASIGVLGYANIATATAGAFINGSGTGKVISGRSGGSPDGPFPEVFRVEGDGDVAANVGARRGQRSNPEKPGRTYLCPAEHCQCYGCTRFNHCHLSVSARMRHIFTAAVHGSSNEREDPRGRVDG
jgi:hypothetical protein